MMMEYGLYYELVLRDVHIVWRMVGLRDQIISNRDIFVGVAVKIESAVCQMPCGVYWKHVLSLDDVIARTGITSL